MKRTHGLSKDKFYQVWNGIKQRCYNVYSISALSRKLNIPRWKLQRDLKKGILPKGVKKA